LKLWKAHAFQLLLLDMFVQLNDHIHIHSFISWKAHKLTWEMDAMHLCNRFASNTGRLLSVAFVCCWHKPNCTFDIVWCLTVATVVWCYHLSL